jgi:predicted acylesterase/phospholipase RssA
MKGGITSGVVYPAAVYEIAKTYTFKNIGGTSAGAIAAAITAAAQRRRCRDGSSDGFERVNAVPEWLAKDSHLSGLFVANTATRSLYHTIAVLFARPMWKIPIALFSKIMPWIERTARLAGIFPIPTLIGFIPGAFLFYALSAPCRWRQSCSSAWELGFALCVAILAMVAGGILCSLGVLVFQILKKIPANDFGLVKGLDEGRDDNKDALTAWLTAEMEQTAGLDPGKTPLTFGMLWDAKRDPADVATRTKPPEPDVNLEMITTNLTWGRPYKFPMDTGRFFFDPTEMRSFFPEHVVSWMEANARAARDATEEQRFHSYLPKRPFPEACNVPVIVATRMSLAFPVLLSAVPVYVTDFSAPCAEDKPELERCWFSDGGLSSNFPITLFDSALPRWPTFAINLEEFPSWRKPSTDESQNVYMPNSNSAGRQPSFNRVESLVDFLGAIFNAMQNWNDNTQSVLPGYRDRIVTVFLSPTEGGLNLDMPPDILGRLRARGAAAGKMIASRFEAPSLLAPGNGSMDWENHRWLRFRSTMGAMRSYLRTFARAWEHPEAPDVPFDSLVRASDGTPAHRYKLPAMARERVASAAENAARLGDDLDALAAIDSGLPQPSPDLVLRPSLDEG